MIPTRTVWIAGAHRDDGKRFVVRADEKLTAFVELEAVTTQSMATTRASGSGQAIFAQQNTKNAEQENDHHRYQSYKGDN